MLRRRAPCWAAVAIAERHDLAPQLALALGNMGNLSMQWDLPDATEQLAAALALARRHGDRYRETYAAGTLAYVYVFTGRWEELERLASELLDDGTERPSPEYLHYPLTFLYTLRGELDAAQASLAGVAPWERIDDDEFRAMYASLAIRVALATGRAKEALAHGNGLLGHTIETLATSNEAVRNAWPDTLEAALELGRLDAAGELLALLSEQPPGDVPPYLRAQLARGRALVNAAEGEHDNVEADMSSAIEGFRSLAFPYWLARAQTDLAAWLIDQGRAGEAAPLLGEATATLQSLGAAPALARAQELHASLVGVAAPQS